MHHVVGILSGIGEEIFISLHHLPLLLLLLQLLQVLQLPTPLRALQLLLKKNKHKTSLDQEQLVH